MLLVKKSFSVYLTVAAVAIIPAESAADRDEFCQDLTALEAHMNTELQAVLDDPAEYTSWYECACVDSGVVTNSLTVDCIEKSDDEYFSFEQMVFELEAGLYSLRHTSWGGVDSSGKVGTPDEIYKLDNGAITSCKGNACNSCNVCEDGVSVGLVCTPYAVSGNFTCSDGYTGSFSHTFDFGVIMGDEVHGDTASQDPTPDSPVHQEAFCQGLGKLETHMGDSYEEMAGMTFTTSFQCSCSEIDMNDKSFMVGCTLEGSTLEYSFVNKELMLFELNEGIYELARTSWSHEEPGFAVNQPEVFFLDNGTITGCEIVGVCTSCSLCEDGQSIEITCSQEQIGSDADLYNQDCSNGYTGAFANTFDFGEIIQPATISTTMQPTTAATNGTGTTMSTQSIDVQILTPPNETTATSTDPTNAGAEETTEVAGTAMVTTVNEVTSTSAEATSTANDVSEKNDEEEAEIDEAVGASSAGDFLHNIGLIAPLAFVCVLIGIL